MKKHEFKEGDGVRNITRDDLDAIRNLLPDETTFSYKPPIKSQTLNIVLDKGGIWRISGSGKMSNPIPLKEFIALLKGEFPESWLVTSKWAEGMPDIANLSSAGFFQEHHTRALAEKHLSWKTWMVKKALEAEGIDPSLYGPTERRLTRFSPFQVENHPAMGELYYYNDGSANGKFLIGFRDRPMEVNMDGRQTSATIAVEVITEEPEGAKIWNR